MNKKAAEQRQGNQDFCFHRHLGLFQTRREFSKLRNDTDENRMLAGNRALALRKTKFDDLHFTDIPQRKNTCNYGFYVQLARSRCRRSLTTKRALWPNFLLCWPKST